MNRLADAPSPYLRQHQDNPVDWWPWSDAAFAEAARRDVPVFLSIGYATCHWCHVMAHESFEDPDVAAALNAAFVCVKVDREVRPDVDALYMAVCTAVLGHGGWPLTVLLTPDRRPFYVATYLPPRSRHGRPGVVELAAAMAGAWKTRRADVERAAEDLTGLARRQFAPAPVAAGEALGAHTLEAADAAFRQGFDADHGGFGHAPKFPSPHVLTYLMRRHRRTGAADLLAMVEKTLESMMLGGLHDHVGGGFHRYSTDRVWKLPHFEKMLYDQAGLLLAYAEAAALTGRKDFAEAAWGIRQYLRRDLRAPGGALYTAEDADSARPDGAMHEGAFYVWTPEELTDVLGEADGARVARLCNVVPGGNFEDEATRRRTGESILHLTAPVRDLAPAGDDPDAFAFRVFDLLGRLRAHRATRPRPLRDEKVLTDWNAYAVSALASAARVPDEAFGGTYGQFRDRRDGDAAGVPGSGEDREPAGCFGLDARQTLGALLAAMGPDAGDGAGPVVHARLGAAVGADATADDYAFLARACLDVSARDGAAVFVPLARTFADRLLDGHWDEARGLFTTARRGAADLVATPAERYDGALPSANAVAVQVLQRLYHLTGEARYGAVADRMWEAAASVIATHPQGYAAWLLALDERVHGSREVVIVCADEEPAPAAEALYAAARAACAPDEPVLVLTPSSRDALAQAAPALAAFAPPAEGAWAYVCHDFRCEAPVSNGAALRALLA